MQPPHLAHWPSHLPQSITVPATALPDNLETSARRYPDKAALVFFGRAMPYRELAHTAERLAAYLHSVGVRQGDRVILLMQNLPQLVAAHFAILRANAVVVPVNPMNLAEELKHYITDGEVKVAIASADLGAELAKASNALPPGQRLDHLLVTQPGEYLPPPGQGDAIPAAWQAWLTTPQPLPALDGGSTATWQDALACTAPVPPLTVGPQDLSVLPYTSGTTGLPKGCMHTHRSAMSTLVGGVQWFARTQDSTYLAVLPLFHVTGLSGSMNGPLFVGATVVVLPRWDRDAAAQLIQRYRVTIWQAISTMVVDFLANPRIADYDISSIQAIRGGGAAMPKAVAQQLKDLTGLDYVEGYGMTETMAATHINPPHRPKPQCLGIPVFDVDARVVDPATFAELPPGEIGEIVVHGPQVMQGYWNNPQASADSFITLDGKRFLRTGDLAQVDEDGYFFMVDRLKRMINASGFKVWPAEVEAMMYAHPAIQEVCVIAAHDERRGETVKALVVLRDAFKGQVSGQSIIDWSHDHMAAYKSPRIVQLVDSLPKSGTGKVQWRELQEQERSRTANATP